jgi:hypothetical protein
MAHLHPVFACINLGLGAAFSPLFTPPLAGQQWASTGLDGTARVEISTDMTADTPPPIGVNDFCNAGGTEFSAGNIIPGAGFEPGEIRQRWRVTACGTDAAGHRWAELDGSGMTNWDLVTTGYMNGASFRMYRIENASGNALPLGSDGYLDLTNAASYSQVGSGTVPEASEDLPFGGWVCETYSAPSNTAGTRWSLNFTDAQSVDNGTKYYYIVTAVGDGASDYSSSNESDPTTAAEVSATPLASISSAPRIHFGTLGGLEDVSTLTVGDWCSIEPGVVNVTGTCVWSLFDASGNALTPPAGLSFDTTTGALSGTLTAAVSNLRIRFRVQATNGSDTRDIVLNPPAVTATGSTSKPVAPTNVTATPGNGYVRLTWTASTSSGVVGYRVYRCRLPRAEQHNRLYLPSTTPALSVWDYIYFDKRVTAIDASWSHPRVRMAQAEDYWRRDSNAAVTFERVAHPGTVPADMLFAGDTCLQVTSNQSGENYLQGPYIFYPNTGPGEADWYGRLEAGKTYRYEVWMRQEGMENPQISLGFFTMYPDISQSFTVTGEWKLCGFTFTAPAEPTDSTPHGGPAITWTGKGKFWMDNIRLFRCDNAADAGKLFVPSPRMLDELLASQPATGRKGMMRSMSIMLNSATMKSLLTPHKDDSVTMDWYQSFGAASNLSLPWMLDYAYKTGTSPATRMRPWLNISSYDTEAEWAMLCEFLAAPIDPSNAADVAAKPWAYLRYLERGVATPWTDEFECIYIEFANETWHNGAVSDQWIGWGRSGWVHSGDKEFGLAVKHLTGYLTDNCASYVSAHNAGKLKLVMGSNYSDYGEKAIPDAPQADAIGHTTYVGPRWEIGEDAATVFDDHGVQATLLGYQTDTEPYLDTYRRQRETLAAAGRTYTLLGYEGGPSGYSIYSMTDAQTEIVENYGKSQAMAVAALDAWLDSCQLGFADQGYLSFGQGDGWTSHTPMRDGWRRHVPWLALMLRNRVATGSMVAANIVSTPSMTWDSVEYPLVGSYAFRDGDTLTIFLLSRRLDGVHDGHDFGTGHTSVTLALPADPVGDATLYKLAGDPRASNRAAVAGKDPTALNIDIAESTVTLSRETTIDLPPGAIYVYRVKTALSATATPPARAGTPTAVHASTGTTLTWDTVPGATGYHVLRSPVAQFGRDEGVDTFTTTATSYTDTMASGGSTYYYRVAAVNDWGAGLPSFVAVGGTNASATLYAAPVVESCAAGNASLLLSWDAVGDAGGYRIGYSYFSGGPYTWADAGTATKYMLSGLDNGRTVYYVVLAYGASGIGKQSAESYATPLAGGTQTSIASWDFANCTSYETSVAPTSELLAVDTTNVTLGAGMIAGDAGYHWFTGAIGFFPADDSNNFGAAGGGSLANAISRDLYVTFGVQPRAGYAVSLSSITVPLLSYIDITASNLYMVLRYKVGSGDWISHPAGAHKLNSSLTSGPTAPDVATFDLSTIAALQNVTGTVQFRLYFYSTLAQAMYCRAGIGGVDGADLIVTGSAVETSGGYDAWESVNFTAAQIAAGLAQPTADADGDGFDNLTEYALGTDPTGASSANALKLSVLTNGAASLTIPYSDATHDATVIVEASCDLATFTPVAESIAGLPYELLSAGFNVVTAADGKSVTITTTASPSAPLFFRVRTK